MLSLSILAVCMVIAKITSGLARRAILRRQCAHLPGLYIWWWVLYLGFSKRVGTNFPGPTGVVDRLT